MKRGIELVRKFHDKFGVEINEKISVLDEAAFTMRHALMEEENNEYLEACEEQDIEKIADALGDQAYILFGTILTHGLQELIEPVFVEIHRSNMSKLDKDGNAIINGENGIYDEDLPVGKILKGDSYEPPRIDDILQRYFEKNLEEKFLDDELKEVLEKTYEDRDVLIRGVVKDKLTPADWKKFQKFEELADYFSGKVVLLQERSNYDHTRFGVRIDEEEHWVSEKAEEEYNAGE